VDKPAREPAVWLLRGRAYHLCLYWALVIQAPKELGQRLVSPLRGLSAAGN